MSTDVTVLAGDEEGVCERLCAVSGAVWPEKYIAAQKGHVRELMNGNSCVVKSHIFPPLHS